MSGDETAKAPCRHCGSYTRTRIEGVPYCSGSCVNERRRAIERRAKDLDLPV